MITAPLSIVFFTINVAATPYLPFIAHTDPVGSLSKYVEHFGHCFLLPPLFLNPFSLQTTPFSRVSPFEITLVFSHFSSIKNIFFLRKKLCLFSFRHFNIFSCVKVMSWLFWFPGFAAFGA
jgi:hypothetical protein